VVEWQLPKRLRHYITYQKPSLPASKRRFSIVDGTTIDPK